jgi:hypothetical protein
MKANRLLLLCSIGFLAVASPAAAQERVDFFDRDGRRTGYAVVDTKTGRVDFFDVSSRRTGWGRLEPSGRVERFKLDGRRQEETAIPLRKPAR